MYESPIDKICRDIHCLCKIYGRGTNQVRRKRTRASSRKKRQSVQ